jgi:hypothetical protein
MAVNGPAWAKTAHRLRQLHLRVGMVAEELSGLPGRIGGPPTAVGSACVGAGVFGLGGGHDRDRQAERLDAMGEVAAEPV